MLIYAALITALALGLYVLVTLFSGSKQDSGSTPASSQDAYERIERARMPAEIANGKLVISEKVFYRQGSRPFAAKTDQGFLTPEGWLVLVETKTRRRMSASDLVQLSAQAVAIAGSKGNRWRVANWGYVRLAPEGAKSYYQRVELMHASRVDQLWDRWRALKDGQVNPVARPKPSRCSKCALKTKCPSAIA